MASHVSRDYLNRKPPVGIAPFTHAAPLGSELLFCIVSEPGTCRPVKPFVEPLVPCGWPPLLRPISFAPSAIAALHRSFIAPKVPGLTSVALLPALPAVCVLLTFRPALGQLIGRQGPICAGRCTPPDYVFTRSVDVPHDFCIKMADWVSGPIPLRWAGAATPQCRTRSAGLTLPAPQSN